jgi:hypothetical protein
MIFTECPDCDEPILVPFQIEFAGRFRKVDCEACGKWCFVQMTTLGGLTYSESAFYEKFPQAKCLAE